MTTADGRAQRESRTVVYLHPDRWVRESVAAAIEARAAVEVRPVESEAAARSALRTEPVDCLVTADDLLDGDAVSLVERLREDGATLPIVLHAANGEGTIAAKAIRAGVAGYIPSGGDPTDDVGALVDAIDGTLERSATEASLRRRWQTVESLHEVVLEFETCTSAAETYQLAVEAMADILDAHTCVVYIEDGDALVPKAAVGEMPGGWEPFDLDEGVVGRTYRTGETDLTDDIPTTEAASPSSPALRSGISVPVGSFGVLQATSTEPAAFDEHDRKLAELLAAHVSAAVSRIRSEAALRAERDQLASLFDNVPDGVVITVGDDQTVLEVNPAFEATFGYDREEIVGEPVNEFLVPDGVEPIRIADAVGTAEVVTGEITREVAGGTREFLFRGFAVEGEAAVREYGIYTDITDRKRRERRIRDLHDGTRRLMAAEGIEEVARVATAVARDALGLPINGIHLYDESADGLVPVANSERALELLGEPPVIGAGDGLMWDAYEAGEPMAHGDVTQSEHVRNPDTPIRSEAYIPLGEHGVFVVSSPEINDFEKEALALAKILGANVEAALDRADRETTLAERTRELERQNERLDEFAGTVSHDLRNPLTLAAGHLEAARERAEPPVDRHLSEVSWALDRMDDLIEDVLALARSGRRLTETSDVSLTDVLERAHRTVDADLDLVVEEPLGTVEADEQRLLALFENCLRNAREHAGEDATVMVRRTDDGFEIADDGPGIPPDEREAVLETGYTTAEEGTGFGLAIVADVVDAHGWSLAIEESDEGGACVRVSFDE